MAVTGVGIGGAGRAYGSFSAKRAAASDPAEQRTRIVPGGAGSYFGEFSAKRPEGSTPSPALRRTRLIVGGAGAWYGDFDDKRESIAVVEPDAIPASGGGGGRRKPRWTSIDGAPLQAPFVTDDDDLIVIMAHLTRILQ